MAVEVVVGGAGLDPRARPTRGGIAGKVSRDQFAVDGIAEMGQIDAAEGAVPVGAVALTPIERLLGGVQGLGIAAPLAKRTRAAR